MLILALHWSSIMFTLSEIFKLVFFWLHYSIKRKFASYFAHHFLHILTKSSLTYLVFFVNVGLCTGNLNKVLWVWITCVYTTYCMCVKVKLHLNQEESLSQDHFHMRPENKTHTHALTHVYNFTSPAEKMSVSTCSDGHGTCHLVSGVKEKTNA